MNITDLKAFIKHGMLNCVECSPALLGDEKLRIFEVFAYVKTPNSQIQAEFKFTTDRPFTQQDEITRFLTAAGVPKHKINFVYPRNGDYYVTADQLGLPA